MLSLPEALRDAFKEPLGSIYTDAEALLADAGRPVVAVGDVVTYHLRRAGHDPAVAVVDGRTEREAVDEAIRRATDDEAAVEIENEPGTISRELLSALATGVDADGSTLLRVDGEEDLAALPALLVTPLGGSVVYGQPGAGMVLVEVTEETRATARDLLSQMEGDTAAALAVLRD